MRYLVSIIIFTFVFSAGAAEISVKSLSGPPEDFSSKRLPTSMETRVASNILLLDQHIVSAQQHNRNVRTTSSSFSVNEGYGFSLMQVSSSYPDFGPSTITGPHGEVYVFDGVSIRCNSGLCDLDQAEVQMEAFTDRPGGIMIFSISGSEAVAGNWGVVIQDPVGLRTAIQMDSMIAYDENFIEVVIDPPECDENAIICPDICPIGQICECPTGQICIEPNFALVEGQTPRLSVFVSTNNKDGTQSEQLKTIALEKLNLTVVQADTRQIMHTESLTANRAAALPTNANGFTQIRLPELPAGQYSIRMDIAGEVEGLGFVERTAYYVLPIAEKKYEFTHATTTEVVDSDRLKINLELASFVNEHTHVYAYAEIWSKTGNKPIAWVGGMTYPELNNQTVSLPMMFDVRWLALANESGNQYVLRNIRIQDPETFAPIAQLAELPIDILQLPEKARLSANQVNVDESLYIGKGDISIPVPEIAVTSTTRNPIGNTGILLVHGWCSGDNGWPVSNFDDGLTAVFSDVDTSRSHDAFARRIRDQGDDFFTNSFSVVAHSQGGAAATHLRAFYNSGLDSSLAPRRIQSIGTPYNGTALMDLYVVTGPLSWLIGYIDGCEPQLNMTTVGSLLWRITIPNNVADDVFFYRTRHRRPSNFFQRLQFWRWHCGLPSFAIPGTDDGVVSTFGGSFARANDMGVTDGECHKRSRNGNTNQRRNLARNTIMDREGREPPPPPVIARCFVDAIWRNGGPNGLGYYEYWVDASNSVAGGFPIASYQFTNSGIVGIPSMSTRYGPLFPGLPGQATSYLVQVRVTDTAGRFANATCRVP